MVWARAHAPQSPQPHHCGCLSISTSINTTHFCPMLWRCERVRNPGIFWIFLHGSPWWEYTAPFWLGLDPYEVSQIVCKIVQWVGLEIKPVIVHKSTESWIVTPYILALLPRGSYLKSAPVEAFCGFAILYEVFYLPPENPTLARGTTSISEGDHLAAGHVNNRNGLNPGLLRCVISNLWPFIDIWHSVELLDIWFPMKTNSFS